MGDPSSGALLLAPREGPGAATVAREPPDVEPQPPAAEVVPLPPAAHPERPAQRPRRVHLGAQPPVTPPVVVRHEARQAALRVRKAPAVDDGREEGVVMSAAEGVLVRELEPEPR